MPFGNSRVRVVPPEFQLVANLLIKGKEERARLIAKHLRSEGYNEKLITKIVKRSKLPRAIREQIHRMLAGEGADAS
ncbi:MAG: hypothetical protein DRN95_05910 [Candidatus Hydrothermarchaeota archaeon]|nr:MAG: hypothetical protein DRN95_05910 [Candidatus Hydrothermarchaeota archaeon]